MRAIKARSDKLEDCAKKQNEYQARKLSKYILGIERVMSKYILGIERVMSLGGGY